MTTAARTSPIAIGPTWRRGPDGKFVLPERTLGWDILGWTAEYLLQPDGPDAGEPWRFTDEQARFVLWWYAIDEDGRFVYRSGMWRRVKGHGKDPVGAALCLVEFVGPCRFAGWRNDDEPLVASHPASLVQIAAVAKDQTRTTMSLIPAMLSERAVSEFGIDLGKELCYANDGRCTLQALTTSPRSAEGPRVTFILKNETHHWVSSNEGHGMAEVLNRNAAKSRDGSARVLAISNAHNPGEGSDAEHDWDAWVKIEQGKSKATGLLYDSLEAPADTVLADRESLRAGLIAARGDSWWLDPDRLIEEIYDPRTPPSTSRRFYLNQLVAVEDAWVSPQEWDSRKLEGYAVAEKAIITLGLDGSKSDDHTALIGCEVETSHLFLIGVWDPKEHGGELPRERVDAAVAQAFEKFDVVGFYSDRQYMETYNDRWAEAYGAQLCVSARLKQPVEWAMDAQGGRFVEAIRAAEEFHDAILEGGLTWDGNPVFREHVINARNNPKRQGTTFAKEHQSSSRKVDALAAAVLARLARQDYIALPAEKKRQSSKSVYEERGVRSL